jgi:hypothetical protein
MLRMRIVGSLFSAFCLGAFSVASESSATRRYFPEAEDEAPAGPKPFSFTLMLHVTDAHVDRFPQLR